MAKETIDLDFNYFRTMIFYYIVFMTLYSIKIDYKDVFIYNIIHTC